nr:MULTISPECIES: isochorismatase family protein [Mycetohabitans]
MQRGFVLWLRNTLRQRGNGYGFDRTRSNCFYGIGLAQWLAEFSVGECVLAGMATEIALIRRAAPLYGRRPMLRLRRVQIEPCCSSG